MTVKEKIEHNLLQGANIWYLGEGMFAPFVAVFAGTIGGDLLDASWAIAAYLLVTGLLTVVFGKLSDKEFRKDRLMIWGYFLNTIFTFGYLLIDSPFELLLIQMGLGVASALSTPTWQALYAQYENKKQAGLAWGLASGYSDFITGISILLGGFVVTYASYNTLFILMGTIQFCAAIYQTQLLRLMRSEENKIILPS